MQADTGSKGAHGSNKAVLGKAALVAVAGDGSSGERSEREHFSKKNVRFIKLLKAGETNRLPFFCNTAYFFYINLI